MGTLKSKGAVITGGSSGIGLATAKRFVAEGAYVIIAGRCKNELDKAVAEIGKDVAAVHHNDRRWLAVASSNSGSPFDSQKERLSLAKPQ